MTYGYNWAILLLAVGGMVFTLILGVHWGREDTDRANLEAAVQRHRADTWRAVAEQVVPNRADRIRLYRHAEHADDHLPHPGGGLNGHTNRRSVIR